jgi:hypothetical protein
LGDALLRCGAYGRLWVIDGPVQEEDHDLGVAAQALRDDLQRADLM